MNPPASLILALTFLGTLAWSIRRLLVKPYGFQNLPGPPSPSWLKGNIQQFSGRHSNEWNRYLAETYGPLSRLVGPFSRTWLHVYDAKALYSIAIKDQDLWCKNAGANTALLGPGLLATQGAQHRKQRKMLTPVFSIAYLRGVTSVFYDTTHKLRDGLIADIGSSTSKEVDVLGWMGRAALELLGQGAFGYSFDPLVNDTSNDFAEAVKEFFPALNALSVFRTFAMPIWALGAKLPSWIRGAAVDAIPSRRVQRVKNIVRTMSKRSDEIIAEKRAALQKGDESTVRQVDEGKDIMSILLVQANMAASEKEKLSDDELTAQISTFILAGMDTTSNATARVLHLLALNQDVQKRLRDEILEAQAGEEVPYDRLNELPYLDSVCRETLRLYGPVRTLARRATEDTVLPLHEPIRGTDGSLITEVAVPKGTVALLNLWACNTNKAIWGEDAYEWRPDRFLSPLPPTVEAARVPGVYANLMSFHGGSRSCIGFKYAQLELKVVLAVLVSNFTFELGDKEIVWNNAGVAYPTVGKESKTPEMPLRISAYVRS